MRRAIAILAVLIALSTAPARAGSISTENGQTKWVSSRCAEPATPPSLLHADSETAADSMNQMMSAYNKYAEAMRSYMDCVSGEAQSDSAAINRAISDSAQARIDAAQQKVATLGHSLNRQEK